MKTILALTAIIGFASTSTFAADDIVATAKSAGSFKTLTAALDAAGKTKMCKRRGPTRSSHRPMRLLPLSRKAPWKIY
jgi:hypothetical protein